MAAPPDPLTIFTKLRSNDAAQRREAEIWLFGEAKGMESPAQGSLSFVNLDDDREDEAILMLDVPLAQLAFVFDRTQAGWSKIGSFVTEVRAVRRPPVIETRIIGDRRVVLVRRHGWLSQGGESIATLYLLLRGKLKPILKFVEEEGYPVWGSGLKHDAWQTMYVLDNGSVLIHGRTIRSPMGAPDVAELAAWDKGQTSSCDVYSWDPKHEVLSRDPAQTRKECAILRTRRPVAPANR